MMVNAVTYARAGVIHHRECLETRRGAARTIRLITNVMPAVVRTATIATSMIAYRLPLPAALTISILTGLILAWVFGSGPEGVFGSVNACFFEEIVHCGIEVAHSRGQRFIPCLYLGQLVPAGRRDGKCLCVPRQGFP